MRPVMDALVARRGSGAVLAATSRALKQLVAVGSRRHTTAACACGLDAQGSSCHDSVSCFSTAM
jgi:hypothetical protein